MRGTSRMAFTPASPPNRIRVWRRASAGRRWATSRSSRWASRRYRRRAGRPGSPPGAAGRGRASAGSARAGRLPLGDPRPSRARRGQPVQQALAALAGGGGADHGGCRESGPLRSRSVAKGCSAAGGSAGGWGMCSQSSLARASGWPGRPARPCGAGCQPRSGRGRHAATKPASQTIAAGQKAHSPTANSSPKHTGAPPAKTPSRISSSGRCGGAARKGVPRRGPSGGGWPPGATHGWVELGCSNGSSPLCLTAIAPKIRRALYRQKQGEPPRRQERGGKTGREAKTERLNLLIGFSPRPLR